MSRVLHDDLFAGDSVASAESRRVDWSRTALGPVERWPQSLRTSVSICLNSAFAILVWWGPELVMLYNDAYIPIISKKHPHALGARGSEIFPEVWDTIGPMLEGVMKTGRPVRADDLLLFLERNGYPEECYFTFSYSPILDESGGVGGVFTPVQETTERVINERRLRTLTDLADVRTEQAGSVEAACHALMGVLAANRIDLPFTAIYLIDANGDKARRCERSSECSEDLTPTEVTGSSAWLPLDRVLAGEIALLKPEDLSHHDLPHGFWGLAVQEMVAVPLRQSGSDRAKGFVLAAVNPRKRLNDDYLSFLGLVANHVTGTLADAEAFRQERDRSKALAEIDRAKTIFFSNVSHEFRTPLTLITGPLEEVVSDSTLSREVRERLELAQRNTLRLQKLVNNLLDFSRIEAGRVEGVFEPVDLLQLTEDLVSSFRSTFDKAGLTLTVSATGPIGPVYVDRDMWEKIVLNLLSNAFKFTLRGGVAVTLAQANGLVRLVVEDTGTGIPQAELPKIFQRFQRVEGAPGRSIEGTGIGLALVQELVKIHDGTIEVESELGQGSRFTIAIPAGSDHLDIPDEQQRRHTSGRVNAFVTEALRWIPGTAPEDVGLSSLDVPAEATAPAALAIDGERKCVLLADDNPDMREYVTRLLKNSYDVEGASNGMEALAAIRRRRPDLILSDVMMPVMDGLELLTAIRDDPGLASLPFILLSAKAGEEAHIEGLSAGADDYLVKPFSARELMARVGSALKISELRATSEKSLRSSEQELRYTLELNPQIPWTAEPNGDIKEFTDRWLHLTGLTREQALGRGWEMLQHPDDLARATAAWRGAVESGRPYDVEHRIMTSEGTYRWVRSRAFPRFDEHGKIVKWYGTTEDIDARKRAEEVMISSERRVRVAQAAAGVVIWEWRFGESEITWGPGAERLYGRAADQMTFETWAESLHADDRERTVAALERALASGSNYDAEYRVVWPDGSVHWLIAKAELFRDSANDAPGVIGANIDITLRKQAEQELRNSEARVREVLERTSDAVFTLDRDWRFAFLNSNAVTLIAAGRDLLGKNIWEEFPSALDRTFHREYHRAMNEHVPVQFEEYYPEPLEAWFDVHAYPTEQGIAVFFRDITTKRRSEVALRQNEKLAAAGRLAASISHEINNPLEAVTNLLYLLEAESGLSTLGRSWLETAQSELARVSHIANQTLKFYRQSTRATPVAIAEVLESVLSLYALRHRQADVTIYRQLDPVPTFLASEGELRQVFANLVGNASDAVGQQGRIVLRVRKGRNWKTGAEGVRVSVADDGVGMSRETMQRLFEPFYSTKGLTGTGLGLWVSRDLVKKHGGFIHVRSTDKGTRRGSTFTVFLPFSVESNA